VADYCDNSKRISDYHPGEVAPARTSIRIQVPAFRRVPIAPNDRRRTPFPRKTAGSRLKERRGSAAIRIHAAALQRPRLHVELHRIQIL
jgi:hypothetical protein